MGRSAEPGHGDRDHDQPVAGFLPLREPRDPILLSPGVTYTLGAFTHTDAQSPGDPFYSVVAGVSYAPGFVFGRALSSGVDQNGLAMPTVDQTLLNPGFFGPSVQLAPLVTIPEPATWMTILGGLGALLVVQGRRRAQRV